MEILLIVISKSCVCVYTMYVMRHCIMWLSRPVFFCFFCLLLSVGKCWDCLNITLWHLQLFLMIMQFTPSHFFSLFTRNAFTNGCIHDLTACHIGIMFVENLMRCHLNWPLIGISCKISRKERISCDFNYHLQNIFLVFRTRWGNAEWHERIQTFN